MLNIALLLLTLSGQSYYWLSGIDKSIPIYTDLEKDGSNGPLNAHLGFDRDSQLMSILYLRDACATTWYVRPSPGHGAIVDFLQYSYNQYALIHEDGFIRLDVRPDFAFCTPVERK